MKSFTEADAAPANVTLRTALERAAQEEQFDRLMAANGPALARLAASYTNTRGDRDDLLQEISIAVWQALRGFRGECSERTFLFRVAHNRAIAYLARNRARFLAAGEDIDAPDPAPNPESGLAREQASQRLHGAIHRLPLLYRQVTTLTLEGLGYGEIAEVLGISESNVGARLTRARQLLRDLLEKRK